MRKFLSSFSLFLVPVLLLLAAIELYVIYYPSTFNRKADDLHANLKTTELLVLGSSHNQNALNPEFLHLKTVNLANASQDIQIDSALFFKYVPKMPKLKMVILELDYFTLEEKNDAENFRLPWYKRFYGIELYPISFFNRISVYASSPSFFNKILIDAANPKKPKYEVNQYGFITNDFPGVMVDENYDSARLAITAAQRLKDKHSKLSVDNFNFNRSKLDAMIRYCSLNKIEVMLLSAPMYSTYILNEVPEKNRRKTAYTDSLQNSNPAIRYFDYERDPRFTIHDFKNDDHLNSNGARKYTAIIDSLTRSIIATN
ncbi:MAG: hypothetical protein EOP51_09650 [Sphingobacteriales bacterium]|nr:MAG: hypothetical protein EOP51_09650 [Sphingobacteriales bacterium]